MKRLGNVLSQWGSRQADRSVWLLAAALLLTSLACNAFAGNLVTPEPLVPAADADAAPEAVPPPPSIPADEQSGRFLILLTDLNIRSGPGLAYERLSYLPQGATAVILNQDTDSDWWQIACPPGVAGPQCWVAGGPQFVQIVDDVSAVTDEPVAGRLAFVDNGDLYMGVLDLGAEPPAFAGEPVRLTENAAVTQFAFAPDGHSIAFLSGAESQNSLGVTRFDTLGSTILATSASLPLPAGSESGQDRRSFDTMQWLLDSQSIAFNTRQIGQSGTVQTSLEDLWLVDLRGNLRELFPPGTGGGRFLLTATDEVLLSRRDALLRATLPNSTASVLLTFPVVNTASETVYYPRLQVTAAGTKTAVPAPDPWVAGAQTALWNIPEIGAAARQGLVADVHLFDPVVWSPAGDRSAFVQQSAAAGPQLPRLIIADGAGQNGEPYTGGEGLVLFAWSPDSTAFLYAGAGFYAVGRSGMPPVQQVLSDGRLASAAVWLTDEAYLVSTGSPVDASWQITARDLTGGERTLAAVEGQDAPIAIWLAER